VTNSFKNSQKADSSAAGAGSFVPKKRSHRKGFGVRWKEQNEIFDIETIKENIEGAMQNKKDDKGTVGKKAGNSSTSNVGGAKEAEEKNHDLITNVNEDDLKERAATAFMDDDETG
jgi:hypothetical protein